MDKIVPKHHSKFILIVGVAAAVVMASGIGIWQAMPRGLKVDASEVRIASVERGMFEDIIIVRANTEPLRSVILDSVESGRVEDVLVEDGATVTKGQLLFRLSNPQRNIDLLARQAELAQQISNLSNLQVTQEASRAEHQRRLSDLQFALTTAEKKHARDVRLASQGFIPAVLVEESSDQLIQQTHALKQELESGDSEAKVRSDAIMQMKTAIKGLQSGLQLVKASVDALAVRAPTVGRLTGFSLKVGQTVKTDDHIGRIDDPTQFKLAARIDEYYLSRVTVGRHGAVHHGDRDFAVQVNAVYPQIKDGRFTVDMVFSKGQPDGLSPGQSLDARITLGEPAPAKLLPNGAFVNDSGGAWAFVVGKDGSTVERRDVKIGRRSNSQIEVLSGLAVGEKVIVSSYAGFGKSPRLELAN